MIKNIDADLKELIIQTKAILSKKISISNYNNFVYNTERRLKKLAFSDRKYKNQETFDLFNLCHELVDITSFQNEQSTPLEMALNILEHHLGKMYSSASWKEIVKLRGPIEEIAIYECDECSFSFPVITFSGFIDYTFAYCENCNDILFMDKYYINDKISKAGITYQEYEKQLPRCTKDGGNYVFSFSLQAPFGVSEVNCLRCDSKKITRKEVSRYQYFQDHSYTHLETV